MEQIVCTIQTAQLAECVAVLMKILLANVMDHVLENHAITIHNAAKVHIVVILTVMTDTKCVA